MPNYKTVRSVSDQFGVSVTTIRSFISKGLLQTTNHRPTKINIDRLPKEFQVLFDPNYMLLNDFTKQFRISLEEELFLNEVCSSVFVKSPKQNGGHWVYVSPSELWDLLNAMVGDENTISIIPLKYPNLKRFVEGGRIEERSEQATYQKKPSVTLVFKNEKSRQKWVEMVLRENIVLTGTNEVIECDHDVVPLSSD